MMSDAPPGCFNVSLSRRRGTVADFDLTMESVGMSRAVTRNVVTALALTAVAAATPPAVAAAAAAATGRTQRSHS